MRHKTRQRSRVGWLVPGGRGLNDGTERISLVDNKGHEIHCGTAIVAEVL